MRVDRTIPPTEREWTWDEVVMAAHLWLNRPAGYKGAREADIERLGTVLWRSRGSVGTKIANLKSETPEYLGAGYPNSSELEAAVLATWSARKTELGQRFNELVLQYVGTPWTEVVTHPWTKRPKPGRILQAAPDRSEQLRLAMAASRGVHRPHSPRLQMQRDAGAQTRFREAVLAHFEMSLGRAPVECPGCGHDRVKSNGEPLLETHHLIPVAEDALYDYRIGVPLCANCHWLSTVGSLEDRRAIMASVRVRHPGLRGALGEARDEGLITAEGWKRLHEDGLVD